MNRRAALAAINKATIETDVGGQLQPEQSKSFIQTIKDKSSFGAAIRLERRRADNGEINKLSSGERLIRGTKENTDDGYRAEIATSEVEYQTKKLWLPWEVTEDFYHENIEGESVEAKILDEMTQQFALDWDDLNVNGDEGSANAFLKLDDGLLKLLEESGKHRINAATIQGGTLDKAHFFAMHYAMPNPYINTGNLKWHASPNRIMSWTEYLTDRATGAGDAALFMAGKGPLGIDWQPVPSFPDDRIVLADPKNFVRVVSWEVRRKKVTGDTDWGLATRDKRGYLFFVKPDFIILEDDAVVDLYGLDPIGAGSGSGS